MGLDLVVTLKDKNGGSVPEETLERLRTAVNANQEDVDLERNSNGLFSKYYRLNWSGTRYEHLFMHIILPFAFYGNSDKLIAKRTARQVEKNRWYFVTGHTKDRFNGEYEYQQVVRGKEIRQEKGNVIRIGKINQRWRQATRINRFKIYDLDILPDSRYKLGSAISFISLGRWEGSNGEVFTIQHTEDGLVVYSVTNDYNEEKDEYEGETLEEIVRLGVDMSNDVKAVVEDCIEALSIHLEKNKKDYVASNNLTLFLMFLEFLNNKDLELVSYYG